MKFRLSSPYGELSQVRDMQPHHGIDFAMPEGTTLRSVADGVVERVIDLGKDNVGKGVFIRHEDGSLSIYGHMSDIDVTEGQTVHAGDVIGLSGNTGHSTAPHLHFGLKDADGEWVDPTPIADEVAGTMGDMKGALTGVADWFKERGKVDAYEHADDTVWTYVGSTLYRWGKELIDVLTDYMPEIGACITILCGVLVMITGNFPKWFARWGVAMTGVVVWLANAKS